MQNPCAHTPPFNQSQNLVPLHTATVLTCCLSKEQQQNFSVLVFTALFFVQNSRCAFTGLDLRQHQTGYKPGVREVHAKQLLYNNMIKQEDSELERTMTSAGGVRAVAVVEELWFLCRMGNSYL